MSKIINTEGVKPGCIYRIALQNFVTYKEVVLFPNPLLNMIIGPNGTGKSTFVCAIILGLCGKASVIGRANKISEYVRRGCEEATIEIELYQQQGQRNVIITRTFDLNDVTTWAIDHKTARQKQVQDLISSLNIQVDNLCQLLPQDRVQDFAKMDSKQLLRSTLSAVGGQHSVTQLDELIECRLQQRGLSTRLQNNAKSLEEQVQLNDRLKVSIDAMQQRKEIEKQIQICEKKKLWIEYKELKDKLDEYSRDMKQAENLVKTHRSKMEPLEKVIDRAKSGITLLEQQKLSASRDINKLKDKAKDIIESVRKQEFTLNDIESAFQDKLERHTNRERELVEAKAKLDKLKTDRDKMVEKLGDESRVKMDMAELQKPIAKTNAAIERLEEQKLKLQHDLRTNVLPQITMYQNQIRNLENVREKRLNVLREYSNDTYQAVLWLNDNRDMFAHPVYEPMMLELNFTEPKFARYLESTVSNRDLIAFTFESSQDMNLFLQKVRIEKKLKSVNAICSQGGKVSAPPHSIKQLSYLGFYTYLADALAGPEAVLHYLRRQYNVHRIPIGDHHTYTNSAKVPANITFYFTENHRFSVRVSAYSGAKSSSTVEIRDAQLLANTMNLEQVNNCKAQITKLEQTEQAHRSRLQELDSSLALLEGNLNELNASLNHIKEGVQKVRTICAQIRVQGKKVQDIENEPSFNIAQERERCRRKQVECVRRHCGLHHQLVQLVEKLQGMELDGHVWKVKLDISRNGIVEQESALRALQEELRSSQATLDNIGQLLVTCKSKAKEKLAQAKAGCGNKLPQDPQFPYKLDFDVLPSDIGGLQEHCYELQTRIACMEEGDERIIKEYEEREKTIAKLRAEVSSSSDVNRTLEKKMENLRKKWLPPLEALLQNIDKSFGSMFEKLGCAGEVKLDRGGGDDDYDKYGISILVRFRASEQLQQLNHHAQSGGERALSTALYLMAMQALTTVPFRCVDEINQGMDAVNERKMFQLLVQVTADAGRAQYFLLTPKLLTNLEYNPKITVHTIMNGRSIMHYRRWDYQQFLRRARHYRC